MYVRRRGTSLAFWIGRKAGRRDSAPRRAADQNCRTTMAIRGPFVASRPRASRRARFSGTISHLAGARNGARRAYFTRDDL